MKTARLAVSALSGVTFAIGLGISGMTDANKVLAFLNLAGDWDPSLALVMGSALVVFIPAYRLYQRREQPLLGEAGSILPPRDGIDGRLLVGSALFGVGWGLAGFCPGPALVSLASGAPTALLFVSTMLIGIALQHLWARALTER